MNNTGCMYGGEMYESVQYGVLGTHYEIARWVT
jgi:hypothetical protein